MPAGGRCRAEGRREHLWPVPAPGDLVEDDGTIIVLNETPEGEAVECPPPPPGLIGAQRDREPGTQFGEVDVLVGMGGSVDHGHEGEVAAVRVVVLRIVE
jgi:hypothetical protein